MPPKSSKVAKTHGKAAAAPAKGRRVQAAEESDEERSGSDGGAAAMVAPSPPAKNKRDAARASPKKSATRGRAAAEEEEEAPAGTAAEENALLDALLTGAAIASTVADVITRYQKKPYDAIATVVTMVCRASGVPADVVVDGAAVRDRGAVAVTLEEVFARMTATAAGTDAAPYALINKDLRYRRFRKAFAEFFEQLVVAAHGQDILHDGVLIDVLVLWLAAMSDAKARAFRHTASLALFAIVQGLTDRVAHAQEAVASGTKKSATQNQRKLDALVEMQARVFGQSVHQRVKDVAPEIRALAFTFLQNWMLAFPDQFLQNKHLRYFSLALHDKRSEVRAIALETIVQVLGTLPTHAERMREFLRHFAERIVEMAGDVETKCADLALKAAALIIKSDGEAGDDDGSVHNTLSIDMVDATLVAIMDDRAAIRSTAGTLLKVFIRCRTRAGDAEDFEVGPARAQTLCRFAGTLREEFGERMAERYLVDALWSESSPPQLLTDYKPFLHIVKSDVASDVAIAMEILVALLHRLRGPLALGPAARDDLKIAAKVDKKKSDERAAELTERISHEAAGLLNEVLERFVGDAGIQRAVCGLLGSMDLAAFNSARLGARFKDVLASLRKAFLTTTDPATLEALGETWLAVAFTDHPLKSEADGQLHELLKQVMKQVSALERPARGSRASQLAAQTLDPATPAVWQRVAVLSGLVALTDQWGLVRAAMTQHTAMPAADALAPLVDAAFHITMWRVGALQVDASTDPAAVAAQIAELVALLLGVAALDSDTDVALLDVRCAAATRLCDAACLPGVTLTQEQQEGLLVALADIGDLCADTVRQLGDRLRDAVREVSSTNGRFAAATRSVNEQRGRLSKWEATSARLATGVCRLFALTKLDASLAPRAILLWTRTAVKAASDLYKGLFHTMRARGADNAALEQAIIAEGARQCDEAGGSPAAVERLYQLGYKLAAMHFLPTDRFYPAAVQTVRWAVDYAAAVPSVLHAAAPYCARLRQGDALAIATALNSNPLVDTASTDAAVRTFLTAIRRAAKLEAPAGTAAAAGGQSPAARGTAAAVAGLSSAARTAPRPGRHINPEAFLEEDSFLADIVSSKIKSKARAAVAAIADTPAPKPVTADGWRGRAVAAQSATPVPSARSAKKGTQPPQVSQAETALSSLLAAEDSEVFIATQEWA